MPRPEKVQAVAEIKERLENAQAVFLTEYAGLSVAEQQELRRGLRSSDAEYKVVKMSLARLAAEGMNDEMTELLAGPTALAFANQDPVPVAKTLKDFAEAHAALLIKGALMGDEMLSPDKVRELAEIEPREVLLAKLAGAMKAPMTGMAGLMVAMLRNSAGLFQALLDKKQAEEPAAPAPAAEAPPAEEAEEAPAEEAATDEAPPEAEAPAEEAATDEAPPEAAPTEEGDEAEAASAAEAETSGPKAEDENPPPEAGDESSAESAVIDETAEATEDDEADSDDQADSDAEED